jgi:hypothetical protein
MNTSGRARTSTSSRSDRARNRGEKNSDAAHPIVNRAFARTARFSGFHIFAEGQIERKWHEQF